jgi:branched-subunit amino acid aminotransferase/4-amino-4-deoxychorismate lyase
LKNRYILFNGAVVPKESLDPDPTPWFDIAGMCLRQSLFASGNRIPFLYPWLELMEKGFQAAGWHLPDAFGPALLKQKLEKLLNKNRLFKGSRIHLLIIPIFPSAELDCSPDFRYMALTEELENDFFPLNTRGLSLGVSERYRNTADPFFGSVIRSPLRSLLIRQEAAVNGWDEILLTDPDGYLSEASESNIFIRIGNDIHTPAPGNRCYPRMITTLVMDLIRQQNINLIVNEKLSPRDLSRADEVFLTDDINGIRWVLGMEKKRYYRNTAGILQEELTQLIRTVDQFQAGSSG